jgi:hypothetical protein
MKKRCLFQKQHAHVKSCTQLSLLLQQYLYWQPAIRRRASLATVQGLCAPGTAKPIWLSKTRGVGSVRGIHIHLYGGSCSYQSIMWLRQSTDWFFNRLRLSSIDKSAQTHTDYVVNVGISKRPTQPLMLLLSQCLGGGGSYLLIKR